MKVCVFPGTFDPFTSGHLDIAERAAALFDRLIIAVNEGGEKRARLDAAERVRIIEKCMGALPKVEVKVFRGLLVNFCEQENADIIVRGIRSFNDFQYENMLSYVNKKLSKNIETVFMITNQANSHISSSTVRELISLGADITTFVPAAVKDDLIKYYSQLK